MCFPPGIQRKCDLLLNNHHQSSDTKVFLTFSSLSAGSHSSLHQGVLLAASKLSATSYKAQLCLGLLTLPKELYGLRMKTPSSKCLLHSQQLSAEFSMVASMSLKPPCSGVVSTSSSPWELIFQLESGFSLILL